VLWLGLADGVELVSRLAGAVGALLTPVGYEPDTRPFHAHLTLARLKAPSDLRAVVAAVDGMTIGPTWPVDAVVLFQSHTRRTGAEYEQVARIPLAPEDDEGSPVG
jgi:2'-5' RNA ligase